MDIVLPETVKLRIIFICVDTFLRDVVSVALAFVVLSEDLEFPSLLDLATLLIVALLVSKTRYQRLNRCLVCTLIFPSFYDFTN